jgi:hypothetical protein
VLRGDDSGVAECPDTRHDARGGCAQCAGGPATADCQRPSSSRSDARTRAAVLRQPAAPPASVTARPPGARGRARGRQLEPMDRHPARELSGLSLEHREGPVAAVAPKSRVGCSTPLAAARSRTSRLVVTRKATSGWRRRPATSGAKPAELVGREVRAAEDDELERGAMPARQPAAPLQEIVQCHADVSLRRASVQRRVERRRFRRHAGDVEQRDADRAGRRASRDRER